VSGFLLDTNVISELRKGDRGDQGVKRWVEAQTSDDLWLSVLVVGELLRGVELVRRRDPLSAAALDQWLNRLNDQYEDRILQITSQITQRWAMVTVPDPVPVIDGLLAATALEHDLVLVTRNTKDVKSTGALTHNPFSN
jgi:toxin FitB